MLSEQLSALDDGVYVFGHKHIQWCNNLNGKTLVNPGSCGVSLDFQTSAAYAILNWNESFWECELRRVEYDVPAVKKAMDDSQCAYDLPVWYGIISQSMTTARIQTIPFINFTEQYANNLGDSTRPFTWDIWHASYKAWMNSKKLNS